MSVNIPAEIEDRISRNFSRRFWRGTVTDASPLEVQGLGESVSVGCSHLASYTPGLSDVVLVYRDGLVNIVLGEIV